MESRALKSLAPLVLLVGLTASACAVGNRYPYRTVVASPQLSGTAATSVATHDQREYVRSGNKSPEFVGLQRGGYGNPFDVRTDDDKPLADAMTTALVNTLTKRGFRAQPVAVDHTLTVAAVRLRVIMPGPDRGLVLTLQEWKSDTMMRIGLIYDVSLVVLDRTGTLMAEKRLQGRDNLGTGWSSSQVGEVVSNAFKTKLEELLDDPAIVAALRGSP